MKIQVGRFSGIPLVPSLYGKTHTKEFYTKVNVRLRASESNMLNRGYDKDAIRSEVKRIRKITEAHVSKPNFCDCL